MTSIAGARISFLESLDYHLVSMALDNLESFFFLFPSLSYNLQFSTPSISSTNLSWYSEGLDTLILKNCSDASGIILDLNILKRLILGVSLRVHLQ